LGLSVRDMLSGGSAEMAVHDVYVQPVGAVFNDLRSKGVLYERVTILQSRWRLAKSAGGGELAGVVFFRMRGILPARMEGAILAVNPMLL
jgi:hypothetical protein